MVEANDTLAHDLTLFGRMLVAFVLSGAIGLERELTRKAAGLRTHILVGTSSALFVILAELLVENFKDLSTNIRLDPLAVLSAVVSGISFLGAGAIFSSWRSGKTKGLTTAASILGTAGVGITCGLDHFLLATLVTGLFLATLRMVGWIEARGLREPDDE
ncbi:MgtC/SapB family protein [Deinococcus yavapaiensis]|uniref:Putative Mg2+ transporter-C (MgtC) family protein n=1 Tax=Deinococcus yavapaiensis KR-236 TaxID=694435 RepID=A0A318SDM0_9DEIO|nr:MgtC/SapB family protein [Deinococcus yavapaiensis]PYE55001.1 putative Mg2+ transporter-C (MgtC) family protein [Deinococcus yavapaiensis KR-236]